MFFFVFFFLFDSFFLTYFCFTSFFTSLVLSKGTFFRIDSNNYVIESEHKSFLRDWTKLNQNRRTNTHTHTHSKSQPNRERDKSVLQCSSVRLVCIPLIHSSGDGLHLTFKLLRKWQTSKKWNRIVIPSCLTYWLLVVVFFVVVRCCRDRLRSSPKHRSNCMVFMDITYYRTRTTLNCRYIVFGEGSFKQHFV